MSTGQVLDFQISDGAYPGYTNNRGCSGWTIDGPIYNGFREIIGSESQAIGTVGRWIQKRPDSDYNS